MWDFLKRTIAPRGLGLAFVLALIPFFCRADNTFLWMFESKGVELPFAIAMCVGALVGAALIAFVNPRSNDHQAAWALVGSVCLFAGIVAAGFVEMLAPLACSLLSGIFVGLGLALSIYQWLIIYAPLRLDTSIVTASIAFLLASALWYVIRHTSTFYIMLFCMAVCIACSGLLCLMFLVVDTQREHLAPEREAELEAAEAAGAPAAAAAAAASATSADGASADGATPAAAAAPFSHAESSAPAATESEAGETLVPRWIGVAAAIGLWFNFFTLGLTFYPEEAGVASQAIALKPLPYLIVLVVLFVVTFFVSKRESGYAIFLTTMLAVAAAIMLASPFIEGAVDPGSHLMDVAYAGVALFNVLGFALPLRRLKETDRAFSQGAAALVSGSGLSLAIGMLVFQLLGQSGQLVSLCLMTAYLVMLVILSLHSSLKAPSPKPAESLEGEGAASIPEAEGMPQTMPEPEVEVEVEVEPDASAGSEKSEPAAAGSDGVEPAAVEIPDLRKLACEQLAKQYQLSPRESEVLWLLARGYGTRYIADKLYISADTVRTHCKRIYEKTGVHTKEELIELIESFEPQG